jgi:hypothetical protein
MSIISIFEKSPSGTKKKINTVHPKTGKKCVAVWNTKAGTITFSDGTVIQA